MDDDSSSSPKGAGGQVGCLAMVSVYGLPVLMVVATLAIRHIFQWSLGKSVLAVLAAMSAFYVVLHVLFITIWLRARSCAGWIELDCGANPLKLTYLLLGASWGGVAFLSIVAIAIAAFLGKKDLEPYIVIALGLATVSSFCLIMAFGRLQILENGIWRHISLLKWDRIESYEWQRAEKPTLLLTVRRKVPLFRRSALAIPLEHADAVDELLAKYVSIQQDDFKEPGFRESIERPPSQFNQYGDSQ